MMKRQRWIALSGLVLFCGVATAACALQAGNQQSARTEAVAEPTIPAGIVWYPTLDSGLREARRTGRPILLLSAAPHCAGVSGIW